MLMEWNLRSPISVFGAFGGGELALVARGVLSVFAESSPRSVVGVDEGHTHHPRLLLPPPSFPPAHGNEIHYLLYCCCCRCSGAAGWRKSRTSSGGRGGRLVGKGKRVGPPHPMFHSLVTREVHANINSTARQTERQTYFAAWR